MKKSRIHVYDKAKYHLEEVEGFGLPEEHAFHHTTFFFSWLIKNELLSESFCLSISGQVNDYLQGKITINQLYGSLDACLTSDMLNAEGNAFAKAYFDFNKGKYLDDYHQYLQKKLPSEFHVAYTKGNEDTIHAVISDRFIAWKKKVGKMA